MLKQPSLVQEIEMKTEFRALIRKEGRLVAIQALYEILMAGSWLSEVLLEEQNGKA